VQRVIERAAASQCIVTSVAELDQRPDEHEHGHHATLDHETAERDTGKPVEKSQSVRSRAPHRETGAIANAMNQ